MSMATEKLKDVPIHSVTQAGQGLPGDLVVIINRISDSGVYTPCDGGGPALEAHIGKYIRDASKKHEVEAIMKLNFEWNKNSNMTSIVKTNEKIATDAIPFNMGLTLHSYLIEKSKIYKQGLEVLGFSKYI